MVWKATWPVTPSEYAPGCAALPTSSPNGTDAYLRTPARTAGRPLSVSRALRTASSAHIQGGCRRAPCPRVTAAQRGVFLIYPSLGVMRSSDLVRGRLWDHRRRLDGQRHTGYCELPEPGDPLVVRAGLGCLAGAGCPGTGSRTRGRMRRWQARRSAQGGGSEDDQDCRRGGSGPKPLEQALVDLPLADEPVQRGRAALPSVPASVMTTVSGCWWIIPASRSMSWVPVACSSTPLPGAAGSCRCRGCRRGRARPAAGTPTGSRRNANSAML